MSTAMEQAAHWLLRLREDSLSEEETAQWLDWCEADPANLAAFEKAQALWRSIPPHLGAAFARPRTQFVPRWKAAAAIGAVAATAALFALHDRLATTRIEAPQRMNESSVLPDGSHVALGAASRVAFDFTDEHRHLRIQDGTAFFRVHPDRTRPFVVSAGPVSVTAIGTAFNVRVNAQRIVVAVQEGLVAIEGPKRDSLRVSAGQRLIYDAKSRETRLESTDPAAELAWQRGQLIYDGEPLDAVLENVNRYASEKIVLADATLSELHFTGTVFVDSIDTWLGALPRAFPVEVSSSADGKIVVTRAAQRAP